MRQKYLVEFLLKELIFGIESPILIFPKRFVFPLTSAIGLELTRLQNGLSF